MRKKQFRTESRKMLDMMIHSIYTHREIFLRELVSNASDAIDKRAFRALTEPEIGLPREQYAITLVPDKAQRTLTVRDNGCGMTAEELEQNLGTIAKSGSLEFKRANETPEEVPVIGQFGVGFYSAFMVSDRVEVRSRAVGTAESSVWVSEGADGYTVGEGPAMEPGTEIVLHLLPDTEDEHYGEFLEDYRLRALVRKYSDYIRYPIRMAVETPAEKEGEAPVRREETLNSMTPLWHRSPKDVKPEEYDSFYADKFAPGERPARVVHFRTEGAVSYEALLFVPARAPFDFYSRSYEKGLQLYCNGMLVMERCAELLPDCFSFVRGMVDSPDFTLNISRETLQHDRQLQLIGRGLEKRISAELEKLLTEDRPAYEAFFGEFGTQLKYGVYADFGARRELLEKLLLFRSSKGDALTTLAEYAARMPEGQKAIYYACAESAAAAALLPQTERVTARGYEVLFLTEDVDEFTLRILGTSGDKPFANVSAEDADLATDAEKEALRAENEGAQALLGYLKEQLGGKVSAVRFTNALGSHAVCLASTGAVSTGMEKVLSRMPGGETAEHPKAETILEINLNHPVAAALKALYPDRKEKAAAYAQILYAQARLICGLPVENPTELSDLVCGLMTDAGKE